MRLFTVGHSNRTLEEFLDVLQAHGIRQLADVRVVPRSGRFPHFCDDNLERSLARAGIAWRHIEALGGMRKPSKDSPNQGWEVEGFRGYADYMATYDFKRALGDLMEWAQAAPTAVMCAEARPTQCHRRLISDALVVRGVDVEHVGAGGEDGPHRVTEFADVRNGDLIYPFTLAG